MIERRRNHEAALHVLSHVPPDVSVFPEALFALNAGVSVRKPLRSRTAIVRLLFHPRERKVRKNDGFPHGSQGPMFPGTRVIDENRPLKTNG